MINEYIKSGYQWIITIGSTQPKPFQSIARPPIDDGNGEEFVYT